MLKRESRAFVTNLFFAAFYARFAMIHLQTFLHIGQWHVAPFVLQESMLAVFFLTRRPACDVSQAGIDWIIAGMGTFLPLLIRPAGPAWWVGVPLQMVGLTISIAALGSLRRSFGIVPANRGVCGDGLYAWVRHPMYVGHFCTLAGYGFTYPSWHNTCLILVTISMLILRTLTEEQLLRRDPLYVFYTTLVRWRLIPGVF
jgi:protein-S-isoprenylcysteine O-methyltransferase Ste14